MKISFVVGCHTRLLEEILARLDGLCKAAFGDREIAGTDFLAVLILLGYNPRTNGPRLCDGHIPYLSSKESSNEEGRPVFGSCHLGRCARM